MDELYNVPDSTKNPRWSVGSYKKEAMNLLGFDADPLRTGRFSLGQGQSQHPIGDLCLDAIRVDRRGQAQGPGEGAGWQFADEVVALLRLVLAFDAEHILQYLDIQVFGLKAGDQGRENISVILFTDVDA